MGPPQKKRRRAGVWRRLDRPVVDDVLRMLGHWGRMTALSDWTRVDASIKGKEGMAQWGRRVAVSTGADTIVFNLVHHHPGSGAAMFGACGFEHAQNVHDDVRERAENLLYATYDEARRQQREVNKAAAEAHAQAATENGAPQAGQPGPSAPRTDSATGTGEEREDSGEPSGAQGESATDATEFLAALAQEAGRASGSGAGPVTEADSTATPRRSRWDQ
jgi:hypothetical protein